jgi:hypothetical protein
MYRLLLRSLPALVAVLALAACGDDEFETPTSPIAPTIITETFSGTVTLNGAQVHSFATQASGSVTATLKFLVPDPAVRMGFALGTWNGSSCSLVIAKTDAVESTVIIRLGQPVRVYPRRREPHGADRVRDRGSAPVGAGYARPVRIPSR